jgi:hypothetical protein
MFRIEVLGQRREPDEVGEKDRHPPTLGGGSRAGGRLTRLGRLSDLVTAGAAESESRGELGATGGTGLRQRPSAATAEPKAGWILECASRAAHGADSVRRRADATV